MKLRNTPARLLEDSDSEKPNVIKMSENEVIAEYRSKIDEDDRANLEEKHSIHDLKEQNK